MSKSLKFGQICKKNLFFYWTKLSKILDFGRNLTKRRFWSKFTKISNLVEIFIKILIFSILVKIYQMIMLIMIIIVEKYRFGPKFVSVFISVKIVE